MRGKHLKVLLLVVGMSQSNFLPSFAQSQNDLLSGMLASNWADSVMEQMTLDEKIGQLFMKIYY